MKSRILISCQKYLGDALCSELEGMDYLVKNHNPSFAEIEGTMEDCIKLNLRLRTASQVHFFLQSFQAYNADELYSNVSKMKWEEVLAPDEYLSITSFVNNASIDNTMFANLKMKDAIVDRIREIFGKRPSSGNQLDNAVIHLHWNQNFAEIFINTTGDSLAKHGYRKIPGTAPMQEALAAAVILSTNWDRKSPFINPMCGSGTLAIEAALIASNRYPGLLRENYAFMHLLNYEDEVYERELHDLHLEVDDNEMPKIVCSDISSNAVHISKLNARAAGVYNFIRFELCDFKETTVIPDEEGIILFNPEYGERLGDEEELAEVYVEIGDFFKKQCSGYTGYVFSGNLGLAKRVGLKPKRKIPFYSAKIECRLMEYELYSGTRRAPQENVQD